MSRDLELFIRCPAKGQPRGDVARVERELADLELSCARDVFEAGANCVAITEIVSRWAWDSLHVLERVDGSVFAARWQTLAAVASLLPRRDPAARRCASKLRLVSGGGSDDDCDGGAA